MQSTHSKNLSLLLLALLISAWVKLITLTIPYRYRKSLQGQLHKEASCQELEKNAEKVRQVKNLMLHFSHYSIWKTECYTLALTAKFLLKSMGIPSTLYIGMKKQSKEKIIGHAWLMINEEYIVGGEIAPNYNVISYFT